MAILIIKRDEWEFINLSKAYWAKVREIRGEKECVIALPKMRFYLTVPKDIDDKKINRGACTRNGLKRNYRI